MNFRFLGFFFLSFLAAGFLTAFSASSVDYGLEASQLTGGTTPGVNSTTYGVPFIALGEVSGWVNSTTYQLGAGDVRAITTSPQFLAFGRPDRDVVVCCGPYGFSATVFDKFPVDLVYLDFDNINYTLNFSAGNLLAGTWNGNIRSQGASVFSYRYWAHNRAGLWNGSSNFTLQVLPVSTNDLRGPALNQGSGSSSGTSAAPAGSVSSSGGSFPSSVSGSSATPVPIVAPETTPVPQAESLGTQTLSITAEDGTSGVVAFDSSFLVKDTPSSPSGKSTELTFTVKNAGDKELVNVLFKKAIANVEYNGPSPLDYPTINWGSPLPARIEQGSAIAVWQFDSIKPGESKTVTLTLDGAYDKATLENTEPVAVTASKAQGGVPVASTPEATSAPVVSPASTGNNLWMIVAVLVVLAAAGYFLMKKPHKPKGL